MVHSDRGAGNHLQLDREVANAYGPNLASLEEPFHLGPGFVHGCLVKRYLSGR